VNRKKAHAYSWSSILNCTTTVIKGNSALTGFRLRFALTILFFVLFLCPISYAYPQQSKKDSLLLTYHALKNKTIRLSHQQQIQLLNDLAKQYRFRNPDSLLLFADKIGQLGKVTKDAHANALFKIRKGEYFSDIGQNDKALTSYLEVEPLIDEGDNPELLTELYTQLTIEYFFIGQLKKTLVTAYKGLQVSEKNGLIRSEARLRHVLGFIYTQNKLYDEAENELKRAIDLWQQSHDSLNLYYSRSNLARNSILKDDLEKAEKYFQGNLEFFKKSNETLWLARSYMVKSHIHQKNNNWSKAIESNKKYDSLLRLIQNPRDKILSFNIFSELYILEKNYTKAQDYADSTLRYAHQLKDSFELLNGYRNLKNIAIAVEDYEDAVRYSNLLLPIQDVLNRQSGEDILKLSRAKLELEYQQLEEEIENNKKLMTQRRIASIMLLLLAVVLAILLFIRKIAEKRKDTNKKLKELNNTKNKLFSIIGHDLKSPINTLQELLELYESNEISPIEISKIVPQLKQNVDQSSLTLNNLLFWAETQMQGLKPNPVSIPLKLKANEICSLYLLRLEKKNISIQCNISEKVSVWADEMHLEIILRNIISNAIKYTSENGRIIFNSINKKDFVELSICDTGMGMGTSLVRSIIAKSDIEPRMSPNGEKGTGLGLQISRELIEINRGEFNLMSEIGKGSCFYISLRSIEQH
jgi:signal transduction histidine kinase